MMPVLGVFHGFGLFLTYIVLVNVLNSEKDLFGTCIERVSKGPLSDTYPYWYIVEKDEIHQKRTYFHGF